MGVSVVCKATPVSTDAVRNVIHVGDDVQVQFEINDATTGSPLASLNPAAWIDRSNPTGDETCPEMIQSYLTGSLSARAEYDLNVFYVLALNQEPSITVVDPLFSYGGSRLLAMVRLPSPGEDWILSADQSLLYVTMPLINQVAVVDTATWEVVHRIDVAVQPTRIRMQPDGKYLWVSCVSRTTEDLQGTMVVIDTDSLKAAARIPIGRGHHDIAFSNDSSHAFVTNAETASVTTVDVQRLDPARPIHLERSAGEVAFSPVSQSAYVVDPLAGEIVVIDGRTNAVSRRIVAKAGLGTIRTAPGGRYLFVANTRENTVDIIDVASNSIIHTVDVGPGPDQIVFTLNLAYVRSRGSETVLMIPLEQIGREGPLGIVDFTGGHTPFGVSEHPSLADGIAPAPSGLDVVVSNPVDKSIYYYREGMAAPMGEFSNYGREPRAALVVDRSLNETTPGTYSTTVKIDKSGDYKIAFLLDAPRVIHCFDLHVEESSDTPNSWQTKPVQIQVDVDRREVVVGEPIHLTYTVRDTATGQPLRGLQDLGVLTFSSQNWHKRQWATYVEAGVYEATFVPPSPGVYYAFCKVPSLSLQYRDLPSIVLKASPRD